MYEFESCGEYYWCKEMFEFEPNWDRDEIGSYKWKYYWTIDLKVGYNMFWLPVPLPFKAMSMLFMKSFGGMLAITGVEDGFEIFSDMIWPSTPIQPEVSENLTSSNVTKKYRFHINCLMNQNTKKVLNLEHIWMDHGFYNLSLTDLNSYQYQYFEMTILPSLYHEFF